MGNEKEKKSELREIGETFLEIKEPRLRGRLRGVISEARFRIASKRERKRQKKLEMKRIEAQERAKLQRKFIRKKVKRELTKKFTPQEFKLQELRKKRELEKLQQRKRRTGVAVSPFTTKTAGEQILENLGGFGVHPKPVIPRPKKKKPKAIRILLE